MKILCAALIQDKLNTALLNAASHESVWKVRALLFLGADANATGWCECGLVSALSAARVRTNPVLAKLLLAHGADPDGSPVETMRPWEHAELHDNPDGIDS